MDCRYRCGVVQRRGNVNVVVTNEDDGQVQATVSESAVWVQSEKLLVPKVVKVIDGEHIIIGLARGMLYSSVLSEETSKPIIDRGISAIKGEAAWNALTEQYPEQPSVVLAELLHECVRMGRYLQYCIAASEALVIIQKECQRVPTTLKAMRDATTANTSPTRLQCYSKRLDTMLAAMTSEL